MDFMELYAQKRMTAAQAAALVKSGDWVDYGWAVNTPVAVDAELAKRLPELEGVNFRGGILMWVPEIFQIDDPAAHMTWNSSLCGRHAFLSVQFHKIHYKPSSLKKHKRIVNFLQFCTGKFWRHRPPGGGACTQLCHICLLLYK